MRTERQTDMTKLIVAFAILRTRVKKYFDTDVVLRSNNVIFQEAFPWKAYFISLYITGHE